MDVEVREQNPSFLRKMTASGRSFRGGLKQGQTALTRAWFEGTPSSLTKKAVHTDHSHAM